MIFSEVAEWRETQAAIKPNTFKPQRQRLVLEPIYKGDEPLLMGCACS